MSVYGTQAHIHTRHVKKFFTQQEIFHLCFFSVPDNIFLSWHIGAETPCWDGRTSDQPAGGTSRGMRI